MWQVESNVSTGGSRIGRGDRAAQAEARQIVKEPVENGGPGLKGRVGLCRVKHERERQRDGMDGKEPEDRGMKRGWEGGSYRYQKQRAAKVV